MRPKSTGRDLPPRMLRRTKKLKSGKLWVGYYYNGIDEAGARREFPLGTDILEAKKKWAEFECTPVPKDSKLLRHIFDRYQREIIPAKAPRTQKDNLEILTQLRPVFGDVAIDDVTPQHIAMYRDRRTAKIRANREITLLSHVYNLAREWGYTTKDNPARGVRKNPESPRDFYIDDQVWRAVYECAPEELQDALDLAYLTGQRPADVLKMSHHDVKDDSLFVQQEKTKKRLRVLIRHADGTPTQLAEVLERIRARPRKIKNLSLIATPAGKALNKGTLRTRFEAARERAIENAKSIGTEEMLALAERVAQFQFRDIRPKAASDMGDLAAASKLLGHTEQQITKKVYIRVGEVVRPTK
jgi:integrase